MICFKILSNIYNIIKKKINQKLINEQYQLSGGVWVLISTPHYFYHLLAVAATRSPAARVWVRPFAVSPWTSQNFKQIKYMLSKPSLHTLYDDWKHHSSCEIRIKYNLCNGWTNFMVFDNLVSLMRAYKLIHHYVITATSRETASLFLLLPHYIWLLLLLRVIIQMIS